MKTPEQLKGVDEAKWPNRHERRRMLVEERRGPEIEKRWRIENARIENVWASRRARETRLMKREHAKELASKAKLAETAGVSLVHDKAGSR